MRMMDSGRDRADREAGERIHRQIEKLAGFYVPEWKYDRRNPDAGSVIAMLLAEQIRSNILRYNRLPEQYHMELIRMLGLSCLPAKPAYATVTMELAQDTAPGVYVPKGTKLLAKGKTKERILFETLHGVYVTGAMLKTVYMKSADGKLCLLQGSLNRLTELGAIEKSRPVKAEAFTLFHFDKEGIERNALLIYHTSMFDKAKKLMVKIDGDDALLRGIQTGKYLLKYYTAEGLQPMEEWSVEKDTLYLCPRQDFAKIAENDIEYSLLVIEAVQPPDRSIKASDLILSAEGQSQPPTMVHDGRKELSKENFEPFGAALNLYAECFITQDACFVRAGATISLQLEISYGENEEGINHLQEKAELKIIKRKPRVSVYDRVAECFAEEISFEYYNGKGWKALSLQQSAKRLFAEAEEGYYTITFQAPADWQPASVGGQEERCVRMQLNKADNCYLHPCLHHYPIIRNMKISYSYEECRIRPDQLVSLAGTKRRELTQALQRGEELNLFVQESSGQNALLLGFGKCLENGPVSLYLDIEKNGQILDLQVSYEYSTVKGFKPLSVQDGTQQFTQSGIILFDPPQDMEMIELEGVYGCFIRIKEKKKAEKSRLPHIRQITLNAVDVCNIDTQQEEAFYIEEARPHMAFQLGRDNILDVQVWVSEERNLTGEEMEALLQGDAKRVRVEYNDAGEVDRFFVKWEETQHFNISGRKESVQKGRYYVLDREKGTLFFGDGVHDRIPANTQESAFLVKIRCCDGWEGNVGAGAIYDSISNLSFVGRIYNQEAAACGSNRESIQGTLNRGAGILSSRDRLITEADYVREIQNFSDVIHDVRCVAGRGSDTEKTSDTIKLVVLLKDTASNHRFFEKIRQELTQHLIERCELTVQRKNLHIMEPLDAAVSIEIWLEAKPEEDSFLLANQIEQKLEQYLNPVSGCGQRGWPIGTMPGEAQILMQINHLKENTVVKRVLMTVRYQQQDGFHETGLENFQGTAFHVCRSGIHHVHIRNKSEL